MKLTTVLSSVNNNKDYYMFIPKQILFWSKFGIKFIAVFVGESIPEEILEFSNNIILWNRNLDINTAFVAQNLRIYYTSLLNLPNDELVMITDMDMLPTSPNYYCDGLEIYKHDDFIYYRHIDGNQIYMCYNAANPLIWKKIFKINNIGDIENRIYETYQNYYTGIPGSNGWFIDQELMYSYLTNYPNLKVLNRPIRRLEMFKCRDLMLNRATDFLKYYDDAHFHRSYFKNIELILYVEKNI